MGRAEVLQALRAIAVEAEDAEALFERSVRASAQGVHAAAVAEFGTWEAALAHLLVEYAQRGSRRGVASASAASAPLQQAPATRRVTEAAELPLYLLSEEGYLSSIPFSDLPAGDAPHGSICRTVLAKKRGQIACIRARMTSVRSLHSRPTAQVHRSIVRILRRGLSMHVRRVLSITCCAQKIRRW